MNRSFVLGLSIVLTASGAQATPSPVDKTFGNTIVSTYPDGRQGELWLQRGGTYEAEGRRHDRSSGHWTVKGENLCLKQSRPVGFPFSFCTPIPTGGVGSTWSAKAVSGEQVSVKLVRGRSGG